MEGKHLNGAPVSPRERRRTRGSLRSSQANSGRRVGGPQRVGGCRRKRLNSEAVRSHPTCARGSQPATSPPEAQSSRGGGGAEELRRKTLPWPHTSRPFSPLTHLNPLMAGTVTTRKHARTHALPTQLVQAPARQRVSPTSCTRSAPH